MFVGDAGSPSKRESPARPDAKRSASLNRASRRATRISGQTRRSRRTSAVGQAPQHDHDSESWPAVERASAPRSTSSSASTSTTSRTGRSGSTSPSSRGRSRPSLRGGGRTEPAHQSRLPLVKAPKILACRAAIFLSVRLHCEHALNGFELVDYRGPGAVH